MNTTNIIIIINKEGYLGGCQIGGKLSQLPKEQFSKPITEDMIAMCKETSKVMLAKLHANMNDEDLEKFVDLMNADKIEVLPTETEVTENDKKERLGNLVIDLENSERHSRTRIMKHKQAMHNANSHVIKIRTPEDEKVFQMFDKIELPEPTPEDIEEEKKEKEEEKKRKEAIEKKVEAHRIAREEEERKKTFGGGGGGSNEIEPETNTVDGKAEEEPKSEDVNK